MNISFSISFSLCSLNFLKIFRNLNLKNLVSSKTTATKRPLPPAGFKVTNKYNNKNSTINSSFNKTVYRGVKMFESFNKADKYMNSTLNNNFNKAVQRGVNRIIQSSTSKTTKSKTSVPLILLHEVPSKVVNEAFNEMSNEIAHEVPHKVIYESFNQISSFKNTSLSTNIIIIDSEFAPEVKSSLLSEIRCYGCLHPSPHCTVPCRYPQKCFLRAPTPYSTSKCS